MNNIITVNNQQIEEKVFNGKRVVTFKDIDLVHGRKEGTARKRFNDNKTHFVEGRDFFKVTPSEYRTAIGEMDLRQTNDITLITEYGYLLLVKSLTDEAAWNVQISLVDGYFRSNEDILLKVISNPDFGIAVLTALKTEREKVASLELKVSDQVKEIETLTPKASYYDHVLQSPDLVLITQIAKDYGMSGQQMNKLLHDLKIQYRKGNTWVLYQQYAPKGYAKTKTNLYPDERGKQHASLHTCWTQKGRLFIYDTLKANGILPLMEKE